MTEKLSPPRGTRDFGASELAKRYYIINHIRAVFELYGYTPLETPAMEYTSTLTGKYGDEGDQLIFRVLNSGNFLEGITADDFAAGPKKLQNKLAEKSLRYDLTIPFARYVSQHKGELVYPFKRYQIQPVWRADRPQKGRYREFYQCDADVVGTDSLICEAEIIGMISEVFDRLGIRKYSIHINHRKLLTAWARKLGFESMEQIFLVAIDKLDKINWEGVLAELQNKNAPSHAIENLKTFASNAVNNNKLLEYFKEELAHYPEGQQAIQELEEILTLAAWMHAPMEHVQFDYTLARGLNYYTGAIFEVKIHNTGLGSVSGGGRYSELTASFGFPGTPGVGFSFGLDRLYDALEILGLFPEHILNTSQALIAHFNRHTLDYALDLLSSLRKAGIKCEIYPTADKLKKQFSYAEKKNIPYLIIAGDDEKANQTYQLKNIKTGTQTTFNQQDLIKFLANTP